MPRSRGWTFRASVIDDLAPSGLSTAVSGGLSMELSKWHSADRVLTVRRIPTVVDALRSRNGRLLTGGSSILGVAARRV